MRLGHFAGRNVGLNQPFDRQVAAARRVILGDVAGNVRKLEGHAEVAGAVERVLVARGNAHDRRHHHPDSACNMVAVAQRIGLATGLKATGIEVETGDHIVRHGVRDRHLAHELAERIESGVAGRLTGQGARCQIADFRHPLHGSLLVAEVAANDGYLLQYVQARGIPCYGVEPTASTAAAARAKSIDIVEEFFGVSLGRRLAAEGRAADLTAANNVLAHVPDINDFVAGFTALLKPHGVATFEFPHLAELIRHNQFDTIYHEHFSYLSLGAVARIFAANGLTVFDVEKLPTHGGSLRVFAQRADTGIHAESAAVGAILAEEAAMKLDAIEGYEGFQARAEKAKDDFLRFLLEQRAAGKKVAAYGAAAKGNTFLNFAGVRPDLIAFVVDRNPEKQDKFMPGSRIPIVAEERLRQDKPDVIVILPWNLADEISAQLAYAREWGATFARAIPEVIVQ